MKPPEVGGIVAVVAILAAVASAWIGLPWFGVAVAFIGCAAAVLVAEG